MEPRRRVRYWQGLAQLFLFALVLATPAQATIDRDQVESELRSSASGFVDDLIDGAALELAGRIETAVRESDPNLEGSLQGTLSELFGFMNQYGVDVSQVSFSRSAVAHYREFSEAHQQGQLQEAVTTFVRSELWAGLDKANQGILTELGGLLSSGLDEATQALEAAEGLDALARVDPDRLPAGAVEDLLSQYRVEGLTLGRIHQVEQTYLAAQQQYGEHWQALQLVYSTMNDGRPSTKIETFFALGEQYGGRIPMIGRFVELYFKVGKEYLAALKRLGNALRQFDQGCVGTGGHSFLSQLAETRSYKFAQKFPGVTACPYISGMPIYQDVYLDMDENTHLFFWVKNDFVEGNPDHEGVVDLQGLRRWLLTHGYRKQANDMAFLEFAYNRTPGFTEFTRRVDRLTGAIYERVDEVLSRLPGCPSDARQLLRGKGLDNLFAFLKVDLAHLDLEAVYRVELAEALIKERYIDRRARLHQQCSDLELELRDLNVVRVWGRVLSESASEGALAGMTLEATPSNRVFSPCSQTVTGSRGSFEVVLVLAAAESFDLGLTARGRGRESDPVSVPLDAGTYLYDVNLLVREDEVAGISGEETEGEEAAEEAVEGASVWYIAEVWGGGYIPDWVGTSFIKAGFKDIPIEIRSDSDTTIEEEITKIRDAWQQKPNCSNVIQDRLALSQGPPRFWASGPYVERRAGPMTREEFELETVGEEWKLLEGDGPSFPELLERFCGAGGGDGGPPPVETKPDVGDTEDGRDEDAADDSVDDGGEDVNADGDDDSSDDDDEDVGESDDTPSSTESEADFSPDAPAMDAPPTGTDTSTAIHSPGSTPDAPSIDSNQSNTSAAVITPDLIGQTEAMATAWLEELGLRVMLQPAGAAPSPHAVGRVARQSPNPGEAVAPGSAVTLATYEQAAVVVPDLIGKSSAMAISWLEELGLRATIEIGSPASSVAQSGTVASQSTPAGNRVASGEVISLTVFGDFGPPAEDRPKTFLDCRRWPGTVVETDPATGRKICQCPPGSAWSKVQGRCLGLPGSGTGGPGVSRTPNCSHMPGTIADPSGGCRCPVGEWNAAERRCVDTVAADREKQIEDQRKGADCEGLYSQIRAFRSAESSIHRQMAAEAERKARAMGCDSGRIQDAVDAGGSPVPPVGPVPERVVECDETAKQGGNTPETIRVNVANRQNVVFWYETFSVKDRIRISYGGRAIFDSGCVGEDRSVNLPLQGAATELVISVEPNCAGETGTSWELRVECPGGTQPQDGSGGTSGADSGASGGRGSGVDCDSIGLPLSEQLVREQITRQQAEQEMRRAGCGDELVLLCPQGAFGQAGYPECLD